MQPQRDRFSPRPLSRDEVRGVDRQAIEQYGMSGLVLMENAGRGAAEFIADQCAAGPIGILCGKGNNAGDGYVIARHLQLLGRVPMILQVVDPEELKGDAAANWRIVQLANVPTETDVPSAESLARFSVLVDAMLGTGVTGAPRAPFDAVIEAANGCQAQRIAVDIPSGLDCDTGIAAEACFRADATVTFVAPKIGFQKENAAQVVGRVVTIGIGVPLALLKAIDERA